MVVPVESGWHEKRRSWHVCHGLAAHLIPLCLDEHHLLREGVVLLEELLFGLAGVAGEGEKTLDTWACLEHLAGDELGTVPAAHAGAFAAEISGESHDQRHGAFHEVAVVELVDVEPLETVD